MIKRTWRKTSMAAIGKHCAVSVSASFAAGLVGARVGL
jgi:hypothetical protein